jgi:hypothetical protein
MNVEGAQDRGLRSSKVLKSGLFFLCASALSPIMDSASFEFRNGEVHLPPPADRKKSELAK